MIIPDTSIWIDYLKGDKDINRMMRSYMQENKIIAVSAVFGELLQGVRNKREKEIINGFWLHLPKLNEENLFIKAGEIANTHKLYAMGVGLIDCYLLAAALRADLALWTKDKKLLKAIGILTDRPQHKPDDELKSE